MKMAVDFVSPEGISECLKQLKELWKLPTGHVAKEDKLQVRWIMIANVRPSASSMGRMQGIVSHSARLYVAGG